MSEAAQFAYWRGPAECDRSVPSNASGQTAMGIFSEIFIWWGGNTWGTRLAIWRKGVQVGEDEFGNRYYLQKSGVGPLGVPRRWVTYKNLSEASQVPADWYSWLHHTTDELPTKEQYTAKPWQQPHRMNKTGTRDAWRPQGSILGAAARPKATGDYKAWKPE